MIMEGRRGEMQNVNLLHIKWVQIKINLIILLFTPSDYNYIDKQWVWNDG